VFWWWRLEIRFSCSGAERVSQKYQEAIGLDEGLEISTIGNIFEKPNV